MHPGERGFGLDFGHKEAPVNWGKIFIVGVLAWPAVQGISEEIQSELSVPEAPRVELGIGTQVAVLNGATAFGVEARGNVHLEDRLYGGLILGLAQWAPFLWSGGVRTTDAATHVHLLASLSWRGELWNGMRPRLGLVAGAAWMSLGGVTRATGGGLADSSALPRDGDKRLGFVFGIQPSLSYPIRDSGVEIGAELRAGIYDLDPYLAPGIQLHATL